MSFSTIQNALLLAAYFRGGGEEGRIWASSSDQVVTLSLFYTADISAAACARRFSQRSYVQGLYDSDGQLNEIIAARYHALIGLIRQHGNIIEGAGDLELPADPTFTSCRLTELGRKMARELVTAFPPKPPFPNWPDSRLPIDPT